MPVPLYGLNRAEYHRFMRNVIVTDDCWQWTGPTNSSGYGKYRMRGQKERAAHRILYEHTHLRPIADGMELDHLCMNRGCVRPDHLEEVTHAENVNRQNHANRGKTHCPRGHEYTPENTRTDKNGKRYCRECDRGRPPRRNTPTTPAA